MNGTVKDANTLQPLIGAHVYYRNAGGIPIGTVTDVDGEYELANATGQLCFVTYVGYLGKSFEGVPGALDQYLSPNTEELPEVEVVAVRDPWPKWASWAIVGALALLGIAYASDQD